MLAIVTSMIAVCPFSVSAEDDVNSYEATTEDINISSSDSLGNMLANEYEQSFDENGTAFSGNMIYEVEVENNTVYVELQALTDAKLIVALYDENNEEMYFSGTADVTEDDKVVTVHFDRQMPDYFLVRAYLLDAVTNVPLCKQYEFDTYTKSMQEFFAKTTDDFSDERVLNLDNDNTDNFLVYNDSIVLVESTNGKNKVAFTDNEAKKYVIENIDNEISSLKSGDIFSLPYGEDENIIVKVSSVSISGTTATIYGDDIEIEEAFEYVRIDSDQGTDETTVDNSELEEGVEYLGSGEKRIITDKFTEPVGAKLVDVEATKGQSLNYKLEKKLGSAVKVSGQVGCKFEASVKCYYDAKLFKKDEVEFSFAVKYEASLKAKIELSTSDESKIKIKLGSLGFSPVPGVYIDFTPSIVIEGKVSVELSGVIKGQVGKKFKNGTFSDNSKKATFYPEFKVSGELFIGFSLEPKIGVVGDVIVASAEAKTGVKIQAEMKYKSENKNEPNEIHQCSSCIDGDIAWCTELSFKLSLFDSKNLTWKADIFKMNVKICDFYYSLDTGKFALTECPNVAYKQTFFVVDSKYNPIEGAEISGVKTNSIGKAVIYLKSGKGKITIKKDGFVSKEDTISVEKAGKKVVVLYTPGETHINSTNYSIVEKHRSLSPYDVYKFDGHYYKLFDGNRSTWEEAKAYCETLGGHLATISCERENSALYTYITETSYLNAYFGYTDSDVEGDWKWVTDEETDFEKWADGEPNDENIGEDYAAFYWKFTDGSWNDGNFGHGTQSDEKVYLCEWETKEAYDFGLKLILEEYNYLKSKSKYSALQVGANNSGNIVTRSGLVPNSEAVLMIVEGTSDDYTINSSSLLYISQATVDENGNASLSYYGGFDGKSWIAIVFGECSHSNCEWVTLKKSTVKEEGLKIYKCNDCGQDLNFEEIPCIEIEKKEGEIQIFFANTENWSTVNVHYWGNGATSWPGKKMIYIDTDGDGNDVYTAVIPENVAGIVFSADSGSHQTVDIVDNINDDSGWKIVENSYDIYLPVEKYKYINSKPSGDVLYGDVNGDGTVNAKDRMMLTRYLAKWSGYEDIDMTAADVNNDGQVNAKDRMILTRHLAKWQGYETLPLK